MFWVKVSFKGILVFKQWLHNRKKLTNIFNSDIINIYKFIVFDIMVMTIRWTNKTCSQIHIKNIWSFSSKKTNHLWTKMNRIKSKNNFFGASIKSTYILSKYNYNMRHYITHTNSLYRLKDRQKITIFDLQSIT